MIDLTGYQGKTIAVLGLGRSGLSAARTLTRCGAEVWAWDDDAAARSRAAGEGLALVDIAGRDPKAVDALILSPGIPHTHPAPHPIVDGLKCADVPVIGDIELLVGACPEAVYVGVTGTNGKSTTTALIGHVLGTAGRRVGIGGNLGTPALELDALADDGTYVLEMSSYQLEITPSLACDVAVLLNVSADHLDRHGGMDGYVAAKKRIFENQRRDQLAVVGIDDPVAAAIHADLAASSGRRVVAVSGHRKVPGGVYVEGGYLIDDLDGAAVRRCQIADVISLPGAHNGQNAAAAFAAAMALGVGPAEAVDGIRSYPGLAHRQEAVALVDGVLYVNDSKATNVDAASRALACYDTVFWIAGGRSKGDEIDALRPYLDRVREAFLIGEAAEAFGASLKGRVAWANCGDLETAVESARLKAVQNAAQNPVVLLSPACASFDQFDNFEARGEAYKRLVHDLPGHHADALGKSTTPPQLPGAGEEEAA